MSSTTPSSNVPQVTKESAKKWHVEGTDEVFKTRKAATAYAEANPITVTPDAVTRTPRKRPQYLGQVEIGGETLDVLYRTDKNRATSSGTAVVDLRYSPESPTALAVGTNYALVCLTHGTLAPSPKRLLAESESHKPARWCALCKGEHVPPKKASTVTPDDDGKDVDDILRVYAFILKNWAVGKKDIADKSGVHPDTVSRTLPRLTRTGIVVGDHVNGERALTYQTLQDIENDEDAVAKGGEDFARAYDLNLEETQKALTALIDA